MNGEAKGWNLQNFLDSFILELDKAQDTLSIKGVSRPLTYTVQDVGLELQLFPHFDGQSVRFSNARPGEEGASKITLKFGSITDRQIREVTKSPVTRDDVTIDMIDADEETKQTLRKIGVTSGRDLERMEKRNIDLGKVSDKKVDYQGLAKLLQKARRKQHAPDVEDVSVARSDDDDDDLVFSIRGRNLAMAASGPEFPLAAINNRRVRIVHAAADELRIAVPRDELADEGNQLQVALDPYSLLRVDVMRGERHE
jgi:hypothetical protein